MLQIDPFISFELFSKFFEPELSDLLNSYEDKSIQLVRYLYDESDRNKSKDIGLYNKLYFKKVLQGFLETVENKIQAQMLALIYYCSKKNKTAQNLLYYTQAKIATEKDIKIPYNILEECLIFLLKNQREVPNWEKRVQNDKKLDESDHEEDQIQEERIKLLLELLYLLEGKFSSERFDEILHVANQTDL